MFWGFTLILLSIFAIPSLLLSKKPNAKELLEQVELHQGIIGLLFCFLGVLGIVSSILNMDLLSIFPLWWTTLLIGNIIETVLGFILGFGLINKQFLSKRLTKEDKENQLRIKLAPKQGQLGILGLIVGAWMIIASFLFL